MLNKISNHIERRSYFGGILSSTMSLVLIYIALTSGNGGNAWIAIILAFILGCPWNIAIFFTLLMLIPILGDLANDYEIEFLKNTINLGLITWSAIIAGVIAAFINGSILNFFICNKSNLIQTHGINPEIPDETLNKVDLLKKYGITYKKGKYYWNNKSYDSYAKPLKAAQIASNELN